MIPPVPPSVLAANPQFEALYNHLISQILNPDCSTKATSVQYEEVERQLRECHVRAAKDDLIARFLSEVVVNEDLLPEWRELVSIIATYVSEAPSMNLSAEAHDLMAPEAELFEQSLPSITPVLSKILQQKESSLLQLATLSSTAQGTGIPQRPVQAAALANTMASRMSSLQSIQTVNLPQARKDLSNNLSDLLSAQTLHLSTQIRHLELHTHGTHSRHTQAQAAYLSAVAAGLEAKVQILALQAEQAMYTPDVQRALDAYDEHLQTLDTQLREREKLLIREADLYEDSGGENLKECARRYDIVMKDLDAVKDEIAQLAEGTRKNLGPHRYH